MSKGNMLLGQARGSVGDLTFFRRNGEQITRAKVTQVANPRTAAQLIQRMIFATAATAYSRLKSICDHSFEGVQYGSRSQARFMSLNLDRLRANYPMSGSGQQSPIDSIAYAERNDAAYSGQGLIISRGSLPEVAIQTTGSGTSVQFGGFGLVTLSPTFSNIGEVLSSLGASPGDQITIVAMDDVGEGDTFSPVIKKSRYVVDVNATPTQLGDAWDPTGAAAAFDQVKTKVSDAKLVISGDDTYLNVVCANDSVPVACAIILSRQETGGKWLRSNAVLVNTTDEGAWYDAQTALSTWENAGTAIDTENDRYLNNADV